jgi:hypothetical protein
MAEMNSARYTPIADGYELVEQLLRSDVLQENHVIDDQLQTLRNAILDAIAALTIPAEPEHEARKERLSAVVAAVQGGHRAKLERARQRLNSQSWIDIRGCNVGADQSYLQAISQYFGQPDELPSVSAPDWYSSYPSINLSEVSRAESSLLGSDSEVADAAAHWGAVTGVARQVMALRQFYEEAIEYLRAAGPRPSCPFIEGLPTTAEDRVMADVVLLAPPMPTLRAQTQDREVRELTVPFSEAELSLQDPFISLMEERRNYFDGETAELQYYLDIGLLLPVLRRRSLEYLVRNGLRREAISRWLEGHWNRTTPGLSALQGRSTLGRAAFLEESKSGGPVVAGSWAVCPDPLYMSHIKEYWP